VAKYFTSDEHYGHRRIIDFCKRPFSDIYEMREKLIAAHNAKVGLGDITYHLGDIFWRTMSIDEALDIMKRLNGQHVLVLGNHDELVEGSPILRSKFVKIADMLTVDKTATCPKIVLCHYAMRVWHNSHKGSWQLYGHSHAALPEATTLSFDCGVDTRPDFAPWSEVEIAAKMAIKKAAGAMDEMSKEIKNNPWDKSEGAEVLYPAPQVPQSAWGAIKEAEIAAERASGADDRLSRRGRCVE
jgi:calcineurin-like phosphoesterase family protein